MRITNPLSVSARSGYARDLFLQFAIPLATFAVVLVATASVGQAVADGCNSGTNFLRTLIFQDPVPSTCTSMPFLADIPLVILSITCPFAWVGYRILRRRLGRLLDDLEDTGLIQPLSRNAAVRLHYRSAIDRIDMNFWRRIGPRPFRAVLWLISLGLIIYAWAKVTAHNAMFALLAGDRLTADDIRANWWVDRPAFTVLAVTIGTIGLYFALRVAVAHVVLGLILLRARQIQPGLLQYVPKWRDENYGWSPVLKILAFFYLSTVNYMFSLIAVFYMIKDDPQTLIVAGCVATIGVISNLMIILIPFVKIIAAHRTVAEQLRRRLAQREADAQNVGSYVVAATDLITWKRIPVSSLATTAIQVLAGGYSLTQAVVAFM